MPVRHKYPAIGKGQYKLILHSAIRLGTLYGSEVTVSPNSEKRDRTVTFAASEKIAVPVAEEKQGVIVRRDIFQNVINIIKTSV